MLILVLVVTDCRLQEPSCASKMCQPVLLSYVAEELGKKTSTATSYCRICNGSGGNFKKLYAVIISLICDPN